jgi:hypothetical protein
MIKCWVNFFRIWFGIRPVDPVLGWRFGMEGQVVEANDEA